VIFKSAAMTGALKLFGRVARVCFSRRIPRIWFRKSNIVTELLQLVDDVYGFRSGGMSVSRSAPAVVLTKGVDWL